MIRLKRKVMTVSLGLSTFLIMGTAYAYSDVSTPLQNWYKASFQQGTKEMNAMVQQGLDEASQSFSVSANESVSKANANLKKMADDTSHNAIDSIEAASQFYGSQIESAAGLAKTGAAVDFDKYVSASKSANDREIDQWAQDTIQGLTLKLGN
ncbi:hypothetical protein [Paenibacillus sp. Root444D2]|uniref:hypothetical protein n=1 Tax=Paenibacillus sp. Root444D2 TaxID=1736538 RepID=UPI00070928E5|nr:hypothetical protein [Paenibacillus sp. Root444D2]KQX67128.1 hypothetical protein ASD40_27150 [Paenibacillus sp. Root444D2]